MRLSCCVQDEGVHLPGRDQASGPLVASGDSEGGGMPEQYAITGLARLCKQHVDLDALLKLAGTAEVPPPPPPHPAATPAAARALAGADAAGPPVRIAVARDAAFCFYYQE